MAHAFRCTPSSAHDVTALYPELCRDVLAAFARNCKRGPFKATSGVELACKQVIIIIE